MSQNIEDIPGYYYDEDKRRYFKIPPGQSPAAYSKTTQKRRPNSSSQLKQIKVNLNRKKQLVPLLCNTSIYGNRSHVTKLKQFSVEHKLTSMKQCKKLNITSPLPISMIPDGSGSRILILRVNRNTSEVCVLHNKHRNLCTKSIIHLSFAKNIKLCYTHLLSEKYSGIFITDANNPSHVVLCPTLFSGHNSQNKFFVRRLKQGTPFSCAASEYPFSPFQLSYSDGNKNVLISHFSSHFANNAINSHPCGGRGSSVIKEESDINGQCFSLTSPIHFNGLRNGKIIGHDLRTKLNKYNPSIKILGDKVTSVKDLACSKNDVHIFANYEGLYPGIRQWDFRYSKIPYFEYTLPSDNSYKSWEWHFNSNHNILAVYQRTIIQIWSVKSGELLKQIKNIDSVNSMLYLNNWQMFCGDGGALISDDSSLSFMNL